GWSRTPEDERLACGACHPDGELALVVRVRHLGRQRATALNIVVTVLDFCVGDTNLLSTTTSHRVELRMRARIPVVEIMTQTPVTIHGDATAKAAAGLMREQDIGSHVVVDTGKPVGSVPERDLVTKDAAE